MSARGRAHRGAEGGRITLSRHPHRSRPRASGRDQPPQSRNIPYARCDHDVRHSSVQGTSAQPATGTMSDPSGQPTRARRTVRGVRGRGERREVRRRIRPMPRHTYAANSHGHRRHRPDESDQRQHPQGSRTSVSGTVETDHRTSPASVRNSASTSSQAALATDPSTRPLAISNPGSSPPLPHYTGRRRGSLGQAGSPASAQRPSPALRTATWIARAYRPQDGPDRPFDARRGSSHSDPDRSDAPPPRTGTRRRSVRRTPTDRRSARRWQPDMCSGPI